MYNTNLENNSKLSKANTLNNEKEKENKKLESTITKLKSQIESLTKENQDVFLTKNSGGALIL